jgi:di/tripeptidase
VSDDKASIVAFLAAFDALRSAGRTPSINIKVVWEGEEESGSAHPTTVLRAHRALFDADLWSIGDGPTCALHAGHYGNWVPNPAATAAKLIAQMRGDDARILIGSSASHVPRATTGSQQA